MSISHFKVNNAPTTDGGRRTVQILLAVVHSNVTSLYTSWFTLYSSDSTNLMENPKISTAIITPMFERNSSAKPMGATHGCNSSVQFMGATHGCNSWVQIMGTNYGYQPQLKTLTFPSLYIATNHFK